MTTKPSQLPLESTRSELLTLPVLATANLLPFARATLSAYRYSHHLDHLAAALTALERGMTRRLLITMPPRHGKSELSSVRFPAWYLGRHPDHRIIIASYAADLAERFSRRVRAVVESELYSEIFPDVRLAQDSSRVSAWDIRGHAGGLKAVGVGGPVTGFGANCLLIDDPVKNREEAQSETLRNKIWDWFTSTAYTRLDDRGSVIVIMTRWHEDDLMGRILQAEADGGERWSKLHLPARDEQGRPLWPERYDSEELATIERTIGPYDWAALYMGNPTPREGAYFRAEAIPIIAALPSGLPHVRAWDVAASAGAGDYTAGALMAGPDTDGKFYIADMVRGQWATDERNRMIRQTADLDGQAVKIVVPQDPGSAGVDAARAFVRLLHGHRVEVVRVTGDKVLRADPLSAQLNVGNVAMLRGAWNRAAIEEMRTFPLGRNDDQVDALSDAFAHLTRRRIVRAY